MKDTLYIKQGETFTIISEKSPNQAQTFYFIEFLNNYSHFIIILIWIAISLIVIIFAKKLQKRLFLQGRILIYYFITSTLILLLLVGAKFSFLNDYLSGIITELIGIGFTVFIIDTIANYITEKQEKLYRGLALRSCRMGIYTYFSIWISIYKSNPHNKALTEFNDIESFLLSNDFYKAITNYNFNQLIELNKSYGEYYNETAVKVSEKFQTILAKYASKLSIEDLTLIEHFGGGAYFFKIFAVIKFLTSLNIMTTTVTPTSSTTINTRPFINSFKKVSKENFQKHFKSLIELVNNYNNVVDSDYEKWNLNSLSNLERIEDMNNNESVKW